MKKWLIFTVLAALLLPATRTHAQPQKGHFFKGYEIIDGDTVPSFEITPIYVFKRPKDMRRYERLVRNVKKVYPYAQDARIYLRQMEDSLARIHGTHARKAYTKEMERMLVKKYTPVLKELTFSQGKILIKLIDRETSRTSYQLLREYRGGFVAGFWQGVAKLFRADLKQEYDPLGDDRMIEQIIILYEAGLL